MENTSADVRARCWKRGGEGRRKGEKLDAERMASQRLCRQMKRENTRFARRRRKRRRGRGEGERLVSLGQAKNKSASQQDGRRLNDSQGYALA